MIGKAKPEIRAFAAVTFFSGGGDQIYNDRVTITGPLQSWSRQKSPRRRAETPLTEKLEKELDEWYLRNYLDWFTTPPFKDALASIPGIQLWDDHEYVCTPYNNTSLKPFQASSTATAHTKTAS